LKKRLVRRSEKEDKVRFAKVDEAGAKREGEKFEKGAIEIEKRAGKRKKRGQGG